MQELTQTIVSNLINNKMKLKVKKSKVISSNLGKIKPEMPESVKIMMNQPMEDMTSKKVKPKKQKYL